jgi:ABC-type transporter lipoprotein component MlaA/pimeloyl-ACP methyl ester carboxylesterase
MVPPAVHPMKVCQPHHRFSVSSRIACVASALLIGACSPVSTPQSTQVVKHADGSLMPPFMNDPMEPVNRGLWGFNRGLMTGIVEPSSRVYRVIVPKPARKSVNNFARNGIYPGRAINLMLQGRWQGVGDESLRFLCNTTAGVGGFFDVATRWKIPKAEADFGQTFYKWGWKPNAYLMLPFAGPSDDSHGLGFAFDKVAQPWTYLGPISYATTYNRLSDSASEMDRFMRSEADPYAVVKYAWTYMAKEEDPDWRTSGAIDLSTMETMGVAKIACKDPDFHISGKEMSVRIPTTGRRMKFNCWMQKEAAPVIYIVPGLSSHRLSSMTLAFAEHLYQNGYSVVGTTGIFHPEFMENASTADLPAYPPVDCRDLLVEMTEIDKLLERKNPGHLGKRAFVGFSMGAFQALHMAANESKHGADLMKFDRYLAINPPLNLQQGVVKIDGFNNAPMAWPEKERDFLVSNTLHKAAKMMTLPPTGGPPPFDGIESEFLIGLSFKLTLRDALFSSQWRNNMGVLQTPLSKWRRDPCYEEILNYSFRDYFVKFVLPYYKTKGIGLSDFRREGNLMNFSNKLRSNPRVRVITNRNDFLLQNKDLSWLESTLGSKRVKIFPNGGHLGNLTSDPVQSAVLESLGGLK